jgi:hypothetical protein
MTVYDMLWATKWLLRNIQSSSSLQPPGGARRSLERESDRPLVFPGPLRALEPLRYERKLFIIPPPPGEVGFGGDLSALEEAGGGDLGVSSYPGWGTSW